MNAGAVLRIRFGAGLRLDALHRRPGLDPHTVHREVIARQKPLHLGSGQHPGQELRGDVAFQQPIAVLGKCRVVPLRVVDADSDELDVWSRHLLERIEFEAFRL